MKTQRSRLATSEIENFNRFHERRCKLPFDLRRCFFKERGGSSHIIASKIFCEKFGYRFMLVYNSVLVSLSLPPHSPSFSSLLLLTDSHYTYMYIRFVKDIHMTIINSIVISDISRPIPLFINGRAADIWGVISQSVHK